MSRTSPLFFALALILPLAACVDNGLPSQPSARLTPSLSECPGQLSRAQRIAIENHNRSIDSPNSRIRPRCR